MFLTFPNGLAWALISTPSQLGSWGSRSRQTPTSALSSFLGPCHPCPLLNTGPKRVPPWFSSLPPGASPSLLWPSASLHDGLIACSSSDAEQAPGGEGCPTGKVAPTPGFSVRAAWRSLQVHLQAPLREGLWSRFHRRRAQPPEV